jgi:hypothetical protein
VTAGFWIDWLFSKTHQPWDFFFFFGIHDRFVNLFIGETASFTLV